MTFTTSETIQKRILYWTASYIILHAEKMEQLLSTHFTPLISFEISVFKITNCLEVFEHFVGVGAERGLISVFFEKIPPHRYIWMFWWGLLRFQSLFLPLPVPIPDIEKNLSQIFIFTLLYEASKGFKKALKDLHKTFWCSKNKCENKDWRFLLWYNFLKCTVRGGLTLSQ